MKEKKAIEEHHRQSRYRMKTIQFTSSISPQLFFKDDAAQMAREETHVRANRIRARSCTWEKGTRVYVEV